jgi:TPP-dependent pyruvate/acetoin dehydrogenase alpha subunit
MAVSTSTDAATPPELDPDHLVEILRRMLLIRAFDSKLPDLYSKQLIRGSSHAAIGEEATAVGACTALAPDDYITSTHRGHGHAIAKGCDVNRMMAELLGRVDGYCRGKGGSMHIADFSLGMLGANGIVGGGFGLATGAALSCKLRGSGQVALCFFGDGATNQGSFHENANLAAIWKLPLILMCENNGFAMSARSDRFVAVLERRADGYGIPCVEVDGMDVLAVHDAVAAARRHALDGQGPTMIIANCYRLAGHFSGDTQSYRTKEEVQVWWERDPIKLHRERLVGSGILTEDAADELAHEAERRVVDALEFAKASPFPPAEEAFEDVYA